jgi:hypothetical protein
MPKWLRSNKPSLHRRVKRSNVAMKPTTNKCQRFGPSLREGARAEHQFVAIAKRVNSLQRPPLGWLRTKTSIYILVTCGLPGGRAEIRWQKIRRVDANGGVGFFPKASRVGEERMGHHKIVRGSVVGGGRCGGPHGCERVRGGGCGLFSISGVEGVREVLGPSFRCQKRSYRS